MYLWCVCVCVCFAHTSGGLMMWSFSACAGVLPQTDGGSRKGLIPSGGGYAHLLQYLLHPSLPQPVLASSPGEAHERVVR